MNPKLLPLVSATMVAMWAGSCRPPQAREVPEPLDPNSPLASQPISLPVAALRDREQLSPEGKEPRIAVDPSGRVYCAWKSKTSDFDCLLHVRVKQEDRVWTFAWPGLCGRKDHFVLFGEGEPFCVIKVTRTKEGGGRGYSWGGVLDVYDLDAPPTIAGATASAPSASYPWSLSLPAPDHFGNILQPWVWGILAIPGQPGRYLVLWTYTERPLLTWLIDGPSYSKCCSTTLDTKTGRATNVLPLPKKGPPDADPLAACIDPEGIAHVVLYLLQAGKLPDRVCVATLRPDGWVRRELEADVFPNPLLAQGGGRAFLAWNNKARCYLAPLGPDGPGAGTEVSVGRLKALAVSPSGDPYILWTDSYGEDARLAAFGGQKPRAGAHLTRLERVDKAAIAVDAHNDVHLLWSEYELGKSTSFYPIYYARVELPSAPASP